MMRQRESLALATIKSAIHLHSGWQSIYSIQVECKSTLLYQFDCLHMLYATVHLTNLKPGFKFFEFVISKPIALTSTVSVKAGRASP